MARAKRVALTIEPELHALLTDIANHQNKPVTTVINDFLEASRPVALAMKKAFDDLKLGKNQEQILQQLMAAGLQAAADEMKNP